MDVAGKTILCFAFGFPFAYSWNVHRSLFHFRSLVVVALCLETAVNLFDPVLVLWNVIIVAVNALRSINSAVNLFHEFQKSCLGF